MISRGQPDFFIFALTKLPENRITNSTTIQISAKPMEREDILTPVYARIMHRTDRASRPYPTSGEVRIGIKMPLSAAFTARRRQIRQERISIT